LGLKIELKAREFFYVPRYL